MKWLPYSLILLLVLPGCQSKMDTRAVREKISEQDKKFAAGFNNKDLDAVMSCYWNSPDLIGMFPDGTYRGYEGVKRSFRNMFDANEIIHFEVTESRLIVTPAAVYEWGTFNFSFKPKGWAEVSTTGRFLEVWEEKEGIWVITADHASPTPSSAAPADSTRH